MKLLSKTWLAVGFIVCAMSPAVATANIVAAGTDFLQTQPGTGFDFGSLGMPLIAGFVPLIGNPAAGDFDTAISRLFPAIIEWPPDGGPLSDTIDIEIIALSLVSVNPVGGVGPFAGSFFDIFVELDLTVVSAGSMTINHESDDRTGGLIDTMLGDQPQTGTWLTAFTLNLIFTLVDVNAVLDDFVRPGQLNMTGSGGWTHGPDGEFLLGPILEIHTGGQGQHMAEQVPAPGAALLGIVGMSLVGWVKRRFA